MKLYNYGFIFMRGEDGCLYLKNDAQKIIKRVFKPPRQHGKPRRFHPPILADSTPSSIASDVIRQKIFIIH